MEINLNVKLSTSPELLGILQTISGAMLRAASGNPTLQPRDVPAYLAAGAPEPGPTNCSNDVPAIASAPCCDGATEHGRVHQLPVQNLDELNAALAVAPGEFADPVLTPAEAPELDFGPVEPVAPVLTPDEAKKAAKAAKDRERRARIKAEKEAEAERAAEAPTPAPAVAPAPTKGLEVPRELVQQPVAETAAPLSIEDVRKATQDAVFRKAENRDIIKRILAEIGVEKASDLKPIFWEPYLKKVSTL